MRLFVSYFIKKVGLPPIWRLSEATAGIWIGREVLLLNSYTILTFRECRIVRLFLSIESIAEIDFQEYQRLSCDEGVDFRV